MTNEELVKVQLFYNAIGKDFFEIEKIGDFVIKKQREILNFIWLNDTIFKKWKEEIFSSKQVEEDDGAADDSEITVTLIVHDEDSGDPQFEVNLQASEHDTSLASLIATYSEES